MLTTSRLTLRPWKDEDFSFMLAINQDPEVMAFFPGLQDEETTNRLINKAKNHLAQYGTTLFATERQDTGEMIGFIGIWYVDYFNAHFTPTFEIGWRLGHDHWGQGFATEGAKAAMNHAFIELALPELVSFTAAINTRSIRVMEKIGLHHNPVDDFDHPNVDKDSPLKHHVLYRLSREDYLS